jgi:serine/threonine protein kinase
MSGKEVERGRLAAVIADISKMEEMPAFHLLQTLPTMEATQPLYSNCAPSPQGRLLLTCQASRLDEGDATIAIYEHCLVETSSRRKSYLVFDFDVKFSFSTSPPSLSFEKEDQSGAYRLRSEAQLAEWREALGGRLNQRGFHEQFKPRKKIGKGNFASVYLAEKLENGRNYAVKAFSKEAAYSEDKGKECLIKEIEVMRSLSHRNCMQLYEVFESENSLYIVVELLSGGQLYDRIKAKYKFKAWETRTILHSILSGLSEMHSKRIMHRDLKPENIIFRSEGSFECSIADFGLAEMADAQEYLFVRCGTPGYVAPEVINIKDMKTKYEPICDVFSVGLIFHILLLGVSAFPGKTYNEVLAQNRASSFTFEGTDYKALDPQALDLMAKMLKRTPQERISAKEALAHAYFEEESEDGEERDMVTELAKQGFPSFDSPLLTTANAARREEKLTKKDSCV